MCPFILFFTPSKNFFCYGTHALAWILAYILTNTVTDVKYFFIKKHFHENLGELTPAIFRDGGRVLPRRADIGPEPEP